MTEMNTLSSLAIVATNLTNGAVTDYHVSLDSFVHIKDQDRILLTTPSQIGFGPNGLTCKPVEPAVGVTAVSCESIDANTFAVTL